MVKTEAAPVESEAAATAKASTIDAESTANRTKAVRRKPATERCTGTTTTHLAKKRNYTKYGNYRRYYK